MVTMLTKRMMETRLLEPPMVSLIGSLRNAVDEHGTLSYLGSWKMECTWLQARGRPRDALDCVYGVRVGNTGGLGFSLPFFWVPLLSFVLCLSQRKPLSFVYVLALYLAIQTTFPSRRYIVPAMCRWQRSQRLQRFFQGQNANIRNVLFQQVSGVKKPAESTTLLSRRSVTLTSIRPQGCAPMSCYYQVARPLSKVWTCLHPHSFRSRQKILNQLRNLARRRLTCFGTKTASLSALHVSIAPMIVPARFTGSGFHDISLQSGECRVAKRHDHVPRVFLISTMRSRTFSDGDIITVAPIVSWCEKVFSSQFSPASSRHFCPEQHEVRRFHLQSVARHVVLSYGTIIFQAMFVSLTKELTALFLTTMKIKCLFQQCESIRYRLEGQLFSESFS